MKLIDFIKNKFSEKTWERIGLITLLFSSACLYLINLSGNGYANSYYASAVQAASVSWKALFFGSLDGANFITLDKPPAAIWLMGLSARIFGFSSFSMLLPNALAGILTVWLVFASVKRIFGFKSAFISGIIMLLTPVAALMFRFNNPDAILTLFLTLSGFAFLRSLDSKKSILWLSLAGIFTGLAFDTKMLQGLIMLPIMGLVYLFCAKAKFLRRILQLFIFTIVTAVAVLWYPVVVSLTPVNSRPYIGGSSDNSIWNLIIEYNGLGRLLGNRMGGGGGPGGASSQNKMDFNVKYSFSGYRPEGGPNQGGFGAPPEGMMGQDNNFRPAPGEQQGMGPGAGGFGGQTGIFRIFNTDFGPNIGWLIPFALVGFIVFIIKLWRAPLNDAKRAHVLFWFGWTVLHIAVFSIVSGVIHPYYVVVLAPAVAALTGIGLPFIWRLYRESKFFWWILPITIAGSSVVANILLSYGNYWPLLNIGVTSAGVLSAVLLILYRQNLNVKKFALYLGTFACLSGPVMFTFSTVTTVHNGSIPTAGPGAMAISKTNNESARADSKLVDYLLAHQGNAKWLVAVSSANESAPIQITSGQPVMAIGGFNGGDNALSIEKLEELVRTGQLKYYLSSSRGMGGGGPMGGGNSISSWVKEHGKVVDYGGNDTLYELMF
jgi:4-amino-4-deoxy-L-arabinose transferase-like glycosyltransferase